MSTRTTLNGSAHDNASATRRRFVILTSMTAAVGGFLFGYDTAVISGAILFVRSQFHLTSVETEIAVSVVLAGALMGAAVGGYLGDRFGRRPTLLATAVTFGVFGMVTGLAHGFVVFFVSRLLVGAAVGVSSMLAPLYIAELAPEKYRGALVTLNQIAISTGVVVAYYIDYRLAGSGNWRWMFMSAVIPSLLLLLGVLYLPETPRWLAARGKFTEAEQILRRVEPEKEVQRDLSELREVTGADKLGLKDLFQKRFRRPLIVGVVLAIFQQITGVNTIVYYAPTIFRMVGFPSDSVAILATFLIGAVGLCFTIISMFLLDKVGRRPLLFASLVGMSITLLHLSYLLSRPSPVKWQVLADIIAYLAAFDFGLGPVFWLLISEIYPTTVRAQAMSVATFTVWAFDFLVTATFLTLVERLGMPGCFLLFAILCIAALVFSVLFVPETRRRTLEEIEKSWNER